MTQIIRRSIVLWSLAVTLAAVGSWTYRAADAQQPQPPMQWRFAASVQVDRKADSAQLVLRHEGLACDDGRDVRVMGPDGKPASMLISWANSQACRVVFDTAAGTGTYKVQFGNADPNLPAVPPGVSAHGRSDWAPAGGYTAESYDTLKRPEYRKEMGSLKGVLDSYALIAAQSAADAAAEEQAQKDPARRRAFVTRTLLRSCAQPLAREWWHTVRCEIQIEQAGVYDFQIGQGSGASAIGVLILDGNKDKPLISGWYNEGRGWISVTDTVGSAQLSAGKHVLEFYTNRDVPDVRIRPAAAAKETAKEAPKMFEPLAGEHGWYDATPCQAGPFEPFGGGKLQDACLQAVQDWVGQADFAKARAICQLMRARFAADAALLKQVDDAYGKAEQGAHERNWQTEGKLANRCGFVEQAGDFSPPAVPQMVQMSNPPHDRSVLSSPTIVNGKIVYGLPFELPGLPWGVTSGITIGDQSLYVGTKNGVMHAVDLIDGKEQWAFTGGGCTMGTPLLYRKVLYFGSVDRRLYALDADTGRMLWNFPVRGWIDGSPCADDGRVFFGSRDRHLYAIDAKLGVQRWRLDLGSTIVAPASCDGQRVYIGTRGGELCAVSQADGQLAWKYAAGASIAGGAAVGRGVVYFGDAAGKVHAVNAADGKLAWKEPIAVGGPVEAAPILVGDVLYGGTTDGNLFGINVKDATVGWTAQVRGSVRRPPAFANNTLVFALRGGGLAVLRSKESKP